MTFENFDLAVIFDGGSFAPAVTLVPMEEFASAGTLDAVLRQARQDEQALEDAWLAVGDVLDRRAARAEAANPDLWLRASDLGQVRGFEPAGSARPVACSFPGLIAGDAEDVSAGKQAPVWSAFGEEDEEIIVIGVRPPSIDDGTGGGYGDGSYPGGPDGPDVGEGTGGTLDDQEQNDCRDRKALDAQTEIKAHSDDDQREHGVIIYRGADGQVHKSSVLHGTPDSIPPEVITAWMNQNGVSFAQVIGFVHNHDAWQYATNDDEAAVNRYPSGNDWNAAAWMVSNGAGGPNGADFALYVMDTTGDMREFDYSDRARYESLVRDEKIDGDELPDEVQSDGSSC